MRGKLAIGSFVLIFLALPLVAAPPKDRPTKEDVEKTIPTCTGDVECKAKWGAAQRWILKNMEFKIQTVTDVFIETFGPRRQSAMARVVKEPGEGKASKIVITISCQSIIGGETDRGCFPDSVRGSLSFNEFVNAAPCPDCPQPSPTAPPTPAVTPTP